MAQSAHAEGGLWHDCFRALDRHDPLGRKTYDFAAKMGGVGAYGKVKHYAFSRQPPADPLPGVEFVSESIPEFGGNLQAVRGKNIWMMGGAEIIASFLDAGAIEFSIHVIP